MAANDLQRNFTATRPNHKWAGDITYIADPRGLAVSRRVVGSLFSAHCGMGHGDAMTTALTMQALEMALAPTSGRVRVAPSFGPRLSVCRRHLPATADCPGIHGSMSRPGNCWDNAVVESFFATLKTELVHHRRFQTRQEAKTEIFEYLEGFYNRRRRHSTLGYLSPAEFEQETQLVTEGVH